MKTTILVLAANPVDTEPLRLDEEVRAIDQALRQAEFRDLYQLISHWAVRIEDIQELLLRHQPDIVHFSGHGTDANTIVLQGPDGAAAEVPEAALRDLFRLLKDNIRCVVLNACYSAGQAQAIAEHIDVVIGMSDAIGDDAARNFSAAFYRALGFGRSVQSAFELGCNQIDLADLEQQDIPQLVAARTDPARLTIPAGLLKSSGHYLWATLTVIPLLLIGYFLVQTLLRWLNVDRVLLSFLLGGVVIVGLAFVLYGVVVERGRRANATLWDDIVRRLPWLHKTRNLFVVVTLLAAVVAIGYFAGLPLIARSENQRGLAALEQNDLSGAVAALETATRLAPENGRYHFNLGVAYELGQRFDDALVQYREAQDREQHYWPAYNSWGSLQLRSGGDPAAALTVLRAGMRQVQDQTVQVGQDQTAARLGAAILGKNIGWAYVEQGATQQALGELKQAEAVLLQLQTEDIDVRYYLAGTSFWTAQALESLAGPGAEETLLAWARTEGYARSIADAGVCPEYADLTEFFCTDAQSWADKAAQRLAE